LVMKVTECLLVIGRLRCPTNPLKASGVRIDLVDEDSLPWEIDDIMGRTWSDQNGSFTVSGCGADFGPLNTPDPYLRIEHACPHQHDSQSSVTELNVVPTFLPRIVNLGFIYLDRYPDDTE
uniref:Transthyretin-like family protein n=1 Tax=Angiostrongylus cantonensis TaxID=6313 RepID=A0A0K0CXZ6_ANGCA